ncbi:dipeptide epimerase [Thalassobacillus sp. CUG 92003]|uniref:dipeptide epimerase n=1 Tax=Thalassobacillus sp. CUG 92003 TaxID=2736641 RepID=UPI0015E779F0
MQIIDIQCEQRTIQLQQPFKTALRQVTEIEVVDVTISLENGITGKGSASATWQITGESLEGIRAAISGPIKRALQHKNILDLAALLTVLKTSCQANSSAKAAVDMALHDAYCRYFNLPLYTFFGGRTESLETDMTVSIDEPEIMYHQAKKRVDDGYSTLKLKVGNDEKLDLKRIEQVREAVGSNVLLRLDANQGWTRKQAVKMINLLEKESLGIELVEQPVPARDIEGLKFVTDHVATPIMADESVFSPRDAFQLLETRAADLLNIKLMKTGGLHGARQIADMSEAAGIKCMIGSMMESRISVTAAAHLAFAHSNITLYDLDAPLWMIDEELKGGMRFDGKNVLLAEGPGLGFN